MNDNEELRQRYAKALEPAQPFTDRLVDTMLAVRDEVLAEAQERAEKAEAELARIETEIEAEREKTRDAEGATQRSEDVINGVYNGLSVALRIVRGER